MGRTRLGGPRLAPVITPAIRRPWSTAGRLGVSAVAALVLVMMPGAVAHADPDVTQIEAQINQKWAEAEPLIEQYNAVHQQYEQNLARQAELMAAIDPLRAQLAEAQRHVGAIAAQAYRGSDVRTLTALLTDGTPQALAERLAFLDSMSREQSRELRDVLNLKTEYDAQKAPIDQVVTDLAAQDKELADRKAVIDGQLAELQALRRQAYGNTSGTGSLRPAPCPSTYLPTPGYTAAAFACAQAGDPYVWAAGGPDAYDCSGLTMAAWQQVGVYLPHNAAAQRRSMPYIDQADLQVGDLIFYYSDLHHVAIYVGDGWVMNAPQAGDVVRMTSMNQSPVHSFGRPG